jgi:hypothetical protein
MTTFNRLKRAWAGEAAALAGGPATDRADVTSRMPTRLISRAARFRARV